MLDLRLIRRDPDAVRAALARRGDASRLDEVLDLDEDWRGATAAAQTLRAEQKAASDAIAQAKRAGDDTGPALERMRDMSAQVKALTERAPRGAPPGRGRAMPGQAKPPPERAAPAEEPLQGARATLRTLPDPTAADEDTVLREVGEPRLREGRDHLELAGEMIDMERGA